MRRLSGILVVSLWLQVHGVAGQTTRSTPDLRKYIDKPAPNDKFCKAAIQDAKRDLQRGNVVFCLPLGMSGGSVRYERELRELCRRQGLIFMYETFTDLISPDAIEGCYGAYMDRVIEGKYGQGFKTRLQARADSLFLARADTAVVNAMYCDAQPHLPGKAAERDMSIWVSVPASLIPRPLPGEEERTSTFIDVEFLVEKNGLAKDFRMEHYVDAEKTTYTRPQLKKNYQQNPLWQAAVQALQRIPVWVPGQLNGKPVRTEAYIRVHFEAEDTRWIPR